MVSIPNTREASFSPELELSLGRRDDESACLFGDGIIFIDILGKNVVVIIGDFVRPDLNYCVSGSLGNKSYIITCRRVGIDRRWRHTLSPNGVNVLTCEAQRCA